MGQEKTLHIGIVNSKRVYRKNEMKTATQRVQLITDRIQVIWYLIDGVCEE